MSNADDSDMAKDPNSLITMITFMRSGTETVLAFSDFRTWKKGKRK